jgi:hypothetical protein
MHLMLKCVVHIVVQLEWIDSKNPLRKKRKSMLGGRRSSAALGPEAPCRYSVSRAVIARQMSNMEINLRRNADRARVLGAEVLDSHCTKLFIWPLRNFSEESPTSGRLIEETARR